MLEDYEHMYTNSPVCPYCGYEIGDAWELSDYVEDFECYECQKKFDISRYVEVTYNTFAKDD